MLQIDSGFRLAPILIVLSPWLLGASASAQEEVDLSISLEVGVPILVSAENKADLVFSKDSGGLDVKLPLKTSLTAQWIDVYEEFSDERQAGTRSFLKHQEETDGEPSDCPLSGVQVHFVEGAEEITCELQEGRLLSNAKVAQLLRAWSSFGMWLQLPEAALVGESFELDLGLLAPVLFMDGEWESALAQVSLDSIDAEQQIAQLSGSFECAGKMPDGGSVAFELNGELSMRVDVETGVILMISQKSRLQGQGPAADGGEMGVAGKLESSLSAERISAQAAAKARAEPPRFRKTLQKSKALQLSMLLPSHWFRASEDEETALWGDSLEPGLSIQLFLIDTTRPDLESFQEQALGLIAKQHGRQKPRTAHSSLGKGWYVEFEYTQKGPKRIAHMAFFPLRDGWLRVSFEAPKARFHRLMPTFKDVLKSLKDTRE